MKRCIIGMSDTRGKIAAKLDDDALAVLDHLIKVYLYPNDQARNHWIEEIYAGLHMVKTQKSNHKYPKSEFIFESMWENANYRRFDKEYEIVIQDYGDSSVSKTEVKNLILDYFHWIANELSQYGAVSRTDITHYLNSN